MGLLNSLGIVKGKNTLAANIFEDLLPSFINFEYEKPSDYINEYIQAYRKYSFPYSNEQQKKNINGKIFEYTIASLLIREDIYPIYMNAQVAFVPNINYDLLLYSEEHGPICLSAKTSFRERYKQADLESVALKYVHRRSKAYLISLSQKDVDKLNRKREKGDIMGLDIAVCATSDKFNNLIEEIKSYNLTKSPSINVINSNHTITKDKISSFLLNE